jgi:hypothetical protein
MTIDQQQIPLFTAVATALAAVLVAPVVQLIIGFRQARVARLSADAARVSAETALHNSRNAGIQTVAASRQAWINTLRDTLLEFHSIVLTENEHPYPKEVDRKLSMLGTKVELLLNPNEATSQKLLDLMNRIYDADSVEKRDKMDREFVSAAQAILKNEWNRVKRELVNQ